MKLSFIVPIYNVEKYVNACMESIFRQGLDEACFEVIIINDGTKDKSMEVIADIISQHDNITVINQENQGLSVARNVGISKAKGEYILMPDSDDLLIENSLSKLLEVALTTKADLVVAVFLIMNDDEISNIQTIPQKEFEMKVKNGEELLIEDLNPYQCFVWRTLFRRDYLLTNNLNFVPDICFQDVPFTHECYIKAQKCIKTSWLLNIYRRGHESATFSFNSKKLKDFCIAIAKTWSLTHIKKLSPKVLHKLQEDIYTSFSAVMCATVHEIGTTSERAEIIDFLRSLAPDLRFKNGYKQEIVSFLFRNLPHSYIHIRYLYAQLFENNIIPFYHHRLRRPFPEK